MAEFQEVIKHLRRMCTTYCDCEECQINTIARGFCNGVLTSTKNELAEIEKFVMDWAEKNPEPAYPTWEQWHNTVFPTRGALANILPCLFIKKEDGICANESMGVDAYKKCALCRKQRIPADIAAKLGITPGKEWE